MAAQQPLCLSTSPGSFAEGRGPCQDQELQGKGADAFHGPSLKQEGSPSLCRAPGSPASRSNNERVVGDAKQTQNSTAALKSGGAQLSGVISALTRLAVPAKGATLAAVPEACLRARSAVAQAALLEPI